MCQTQTDCSSLPKLTLMRFNFRVLLAGIGALLIGLYLQLFGCNQPIYLVDPIPPPPPIKEFFWPDQLQLHQFGLVDHENRKFDQPRLSGHWSFVFFGYTHCPDICPITMNILRQVREKFLRDAGLDMDQIAFVFISVDGERDTPNRLRDYIEFFGEGFTAASGTKAQIESLTTQLGVPWSIDEHAEGQQDYLVGHSGAIFLISPEATVASIWQPPHEADEIADRFIQIQKFLRNDLRNGNQSG